MKGIEIDSTETKLTAFADDLTTFVHDKISLEHVFEILQQFEKVSGLRVNDKTPSGVLLGIHGRGVPPGSLNPDPISDQNMPFSIPVFRPDIYVYKGLNYVTITWVRTPTTDLLKFGSNDLFWLFLFLSYSFGVKKTDTFIRSRGSLGKPYLISDHNGQHLYPFSDQNGSKTIPFGAAHTYIADIGEFGFF